MEFTAAVGEFALQSLSPSTARSDVNLKSNSTNMTGEPMLGIARTLTAGVPSSRQPGKILSGCQNKNFSSAAVTQRPFHDSGRKPWKLLHSGRNTTVAAADCSSAYHETSYATGPPLLPSWCAHRKQSLKRCIHRSKFLVQTWKIAITVQHVVQDYLESQTPFVVKRACSHQISLSACCQTLYV